MSYYKSNAVYENLRQSANHPFVWVSGHAWMLVYANDLSEPKLMVLAHGASWAPDPKAIQVCSAIANRAGLPAIRVGFDDAADAINDVRYANGLAAQAATISLADLKAKFHGFGLPVTHGACGKSVNDSSSSAYHNWQRENLGAIKVTDIDLVRIDGAGAPCEIIELKRSFIPLTEWSPFKSDFVNFNVLHDVARPAGLRFTIAYNVRQTDPFLDDASRLSLFDYPNPGRPESLGPVAFENFVLGKY